jgi:ketosteroid isomerase-like protein
MSGTDAKAQNDVLAAEDRFFQALLQGDGAALHGVLTPDFLLIDVMTGSEIPASALVEIVGSRQLRFDSVERLDARVRLYGTAAVVTGQTRMQGRFGEQSFVAHSRYTHVYVRTGGTWQLASAQGTPIAAAEGMAGA